MISSDLRNLYASVLLKFELVDRYDLAEKTCGIILSGFML
jgi:hypothetical protein